MNFGQIPGISQAMIKIAAVKAHLGAYRGFRRPVVSVVGQFGFIEASFDRFWGDSDSFQSVSVYCLRLKVIWHQLESLHQNWPHCEIFSFLCRNSMCSQLVHLNFLGAQSLPAECSLVVQEVFSLQMIDFCSAGLVDFLLH